MGKREQFIRVLLLSAKGLGCIRHWTETDLESALKEAWEWVHVNSLVHRSQRANYDAWLSIYDTMICMAPKDGTSDEPPAASKLF